MLKALAEQKELKLDWEKINQAWQLTSTSPDLYPLSAVTGCIDTDTNGLLHTMIQTEGYATKEECIRHFNEFITQTRDVFKQLLNKLNTSQYTEPMLIAMASMQRIDFSRASSEVSYQCPFTGEETKTLIQIFYLKNNNIQKKESFAISDRMIEWIKAMYILKHATLNLNKKIEFVLKYAWEFANPV